MRNFIDWLLEAKADIRFASFSNDGRIVAYINGKRYVYDTDPVYHERWKQLSRHSPGLVLNQIKNMTQNVSAKQKLGQTSDDACPNCGTPAPHYVPGLECPGCGLSL